MNKNILSWFVFWLKNGNAKDMSDALESPMSRVEKVAIEALLDLAKVGYTQNEYARLELK